MDWLKEIETEIKNRRQAGCDCEDCTIYFPKLIAAVRLSTKALEFYANKIDWNMFTDLPLGLTAEQTLAKLQRGEFGGDGR